jgi:hypothetical protein
MSLRIDQIISLVEYIEEFVSARIDVDRGIKYDHTTLNVCRTSLVDYIEELVGEKRTDDDA